MANTIKLRRSATPGKLPTTSDIQLGELALNTYDGKLYTKKSMSGVESVIELSGGTLSDIDGGAAATVFTANTFTILDGGVA